MIIESTFDKIMRQIVYLKALTSFFFFMPRALLWWSGDSGVPLCPV